MFWMVDSLLARRALARIACCAALSVLALGCASRGALVELDGWRAYTPASWSERARSERPVVRSFTVPDAETGDARLDISYFGRGYGGGVEQSVIRWKEMFEPEGEGPVRARIEVRDGGARGLPMTLVEVEGVYREASGEERPQSRMIGVILDTTHGPYFLCFVGPRATIERHEATFERWLRSFE